ncbi:MAG: cobyrinate a,c-diamide synthase [Methanomassiliicoccus sp.]|nr:cobyrinate a,c-diamide synthase [Methanomassiliicoccus sp.]
MNRMERPRIMIAGERSGTGKSTITLGIIAALKARGLDVQPFKSGPDFLDPMHHDEVADRRSRNLDTWMFPDWVPVSFQQASAGADVSIIEGVMGLYDGADGRSEEGSSAHLAKKLRCPVVLVIDATACSRSVGAVAKGFKTFDPEANVRGVIFNRISGQRHLDMVEAAVEGQGLISLGGIPRNENIGLESRHLGLVPAKELDNKERYDVMKEMIEDNLDLDLMLQTASESPAWAEAERHQIDSMGNFKLALARDNAFNFYYEDNLDIMRSLGANIVEFSPIDGDLPDADGYYFGGGYPELHLDDLASNTSVKESLSMRIKEDVPVYAECGGLMYLCRTVRGQDGDMKEMTGAFDAEVEMTPRLQALGYVEARCVRDCLLSPAGGTIRGHVFHYSRVVSHKERHFSYELSRSKGIDGPMDGMVKGNTLASYLHLHFGSNLEFAREFARSCLGKEAGSVTRPEN